MAAMNPQGLGASGTRVLLVLAMLVTTASASCSPSSSSPAGTSCMAAGGTCLLGGNNCTRQAASSAQDCNPPPENPGGAFCCIALADAGMPGVGGDGAVDAGAPNDASAATDAACTPVLASTFDQSCDADTDCIGVGEVPSCPAVACDGCPTAAVNKQVGAQYTAALSQAFASKPQGTGCGCPCLSGAVCRSGTCQAAFCGPPPADTLSACADAGGQCFYRANATCDNGMGPPDACAYADEFCCLN